MISGGQNLVKTLYTLGVRRVFCVAGESFLPALDAFLDYPDIEVITCRHESGATFMAEAYANLTGKPGIAFVTRGPGACNGSIGLHTATQSSAPVLLFVGLIHSDDEGKEAFQEFDLPQMFGSLSKSARVIKSAGDVQSHIEESYALAQAGRAGAIVLGLPEDILSDECADNAAAPSELQALEPKAQDIEALTSMLSSAQRPLIIAGGYGWRDDHCAALEAFAQSSGVPVAASFRRQDTFDHTHENYVGELGFGSNPALLAYVKQADVIIALGARISDVLTQGYTLFEKDQKLVHIYPDSSVFGKAYEPDLGIEAHPWRVIDALEGKVKGEWGEWRAQGRKNFEEWTAIEPGDAGWNGADMTQVFRQLRDVLPEGSIVTTDAGNFSGWCNRFLRYKRSGRQLAPLSGAMGYAVPSAVSAALEHRDRIVVGFCGDGGFMMTGQEIATAMHHGAKPIIVVCNNGLYGTIRMHQNRDFPGRHVGTDLTNPDFVKLAQSYGAYGGRVEKAEDFEKIWSEAASAGTAAVIEIVMDPRQISTVSKPE